MLPMVFLTDYPSVILHGCMMEPTDSVTIVERWRDFVRNVTDRIINGSSIGDSLIMHDRAYRWFIHRGVLAGFHALCY